MLFRLLNILVGERVARLDFMIALGTHKAMSDDAIGRLVGMPDAERKSRYPNTSIFNHEWERPEALARFGTLGAADVEKLTDGLLAEEIPIDLNRRILDYDELIICGPVFPHEVAGFSGGAKYIVPGIAGPGVIDATHWLGALVSSMKTIGVKDTAVRRVINRAAELVPKPITCIAMVVRGDELHGLWVGGYEDAWSMAADLSAELEIIDTAVTLSLAAQGLGVAPVTDMMIGLNSSVPIIRIALRQEIMRTVVLIRPEGSDARPTVRAVTETVQEVIRADT